MNLILHHYHLSLLLAGLIGHVRLAAAGGASGSLAAFPRENGKALPLRTPNLAKYTKHPYTSKDGIKPAITYNC